MLVHVACCRTRPVTCDQTILLSSNRGMTRPVDKQSDSISFFVVDPCYFHVVITQAIRVPSQPDSTFGVPGSPVYVHRAPSSSNSNGCFNPTVIRANGCIDHF